MRGSNPRPLAHKTNTLPTELMEHYVFFLLIPLIVRVSRLIARLPPKH